MKKVLKIGLIIIVLGTLFIFGINTLVVLSSKNKITNKPDKQYEAILVLGAAVWDNNPSPMLQERLDQAIKLYNQKVAPKIIMSGDNTKVNYDEVNTMKNYAINKGVPSEDIFMDHAGISTYDSIYRAKNIFGVKNFVIVTQNYHLYRSLYISKKLGVNSIGVPSNQRKYGGRFYRETREVLARNKDFLKCIFKPKSKYLGESIPVNGNGNITNDK